MKNTKKLDNNGFSLVELIIVIAIMAILTAVIGSQVIPYMEKSRVSKDKSTLDTVWTSFQSVAADYGFNSSATQLAYPDCTNYNTTDAQACTDASSAFEELVGFNATDLAKKWGSKSAAKSNGSKAFTSSTFACSSGVCSTFYDADNKEMAVGVGALILSNK